MSPSDLLQDLYRDLVILVDSTDQQIVAASKSCEAFLGYDSLLGKNIEEIECALMDTFYWEEIRSGQIEPREHIEGMYLCADGSVVSVDKNIYPIAYMGRNYLAIQLTPTDSEKNINLDLERTLAVLRATLESTADAILVTDLDGHIVNFNRRFAEFWALPEEILQQGRDSLVYRSMLHRFADRKAGRQFMEQSLFAREEESFIILHLRRNRWLECRSRPQMMGDQILGRVYTFADISARIEAETRLQEAVQQAHAANRAKTEFLNHMSHELRTPLNAILGFAQLMQSEGCAPHEQKVDLILKGAWHLLGLINEVLDLAQVESGKIVLQCEKVHVEGIVHECLAFLNPMAEKYQVSLQPFIAPHSCIVEADPRRLRQMILNLLSNAIKYNRPNGSVWISCQASEEHWIINVHDSGVGISPEDQNRLFKHFNRVGSTQHIEGTGIGLAFSRKLAQLMRGDIQLTSTYGKGSCFHLSLPRVHAVDNAGSLPPTTTTKPISILYVDDDATNRLIVKSAVKRLPNALLDTSETGTGALQKLAAHSFDILIVDMNLEDMTGIDLVQQIPDRSQSAVRFMLSANDHPEARSLARSAGIERYMTKPLNIKEFLEAIEEVRSRLHILP